VILVCFQEPFLHLLDLFLNTVVLFEILYLNEMGKIESMQCQFTKRLEEFDSYLVRVGLGLIDWV